MSRQFDVVLTNPPFQDSVQRGKTPHKLWIDFTRTVFDRLLVDGGLLCQVSPSSFRSPNSRVLELMREHQTVRIRFDTSQHFPDVASTFADYLIRKTPNDASPTEIVDSGKSAQVLLDSEVFYLPNDPAPEALEIHRKVIFHPPKKLCVEHDYVTCHNILLRKSNTLSRHESADHIYPVFHTNRQVWWSSIRQDWADSKKVMWTRSGYTKPFFDNGVHGGTDMAYFVRVESDGEGSALAQTLNLKLFRYIYATAKWSGFGNERVFESLPRVPLDHPLTDGELFELFALNEEEVRHVHRFVGDSS